MRVVALVLSLSCVLAGCGPDLGTCDQPAAEAVVYLNGTPYFEGQALMSQSCAGSFCHASGATGKARSGAPHDLNFDVEVLTKGALPDRLSVLANGVSKVREDADEVWDVVESGEMPPGKAGKRIGLSWKRDLAGMVDAMLPAVDSTLGKDKLRNWLACGAPIVSATMDSEQASAARMIGEVLPAGMSSTTATFSSIYADILIGCNICHSKPPSPFPNQALDFSSSQAAYTSLVGKDAFSGTGAVCGGMNRKLVVAGNCEGSLLYQKLLPAGQATALCGTTMPQGGPALPAAQVQLVCDWINDGAKQ